MSSSEYRCFMFKLNKEEICFNEILHLHMFVEKQERKKKQIKFKLGICDGRLL